jgi:hypothetical protein
LFTFETLCKETRNVINNFDRYFGFGAAGRIADLEHSRNWGYAPSGGLGLVAVILIILLLAGRI